MYRIRKTELRINNLLSWGGDVMTVDVADFNDLGEAEPIELTEEWLIKFGFEPENTEDMDWFFKENEQCSFGLGLKDNVWVFYISDTKLKYVHQLQNLYFSLTEDELTIKVEA